MTCAHWTRSQPTCHVKIKDCRSTWDSSLRKWSPRHTSFLPNICLVNSATGIEVMKLLLRTLEVEAEDFTRAEVFMEKLDAHLVIPVASSIRKLILWRVNNLSQYRLRTPVESNRMHNLLIARCTKIEEITLRFIASCHKTSNGSFATPPIKELLVGLDIRILSNMKNLRRVFLVGKTRCRCSHYSLRRWHGDEEAKIQGLVDFALQIKAESAGVGQKVAVHLELRVHGFGLPHQPRESVCLSQSVII